MHVDNFSCGTMSDESRRRALEVVKAPVKKIPCEVYSRVVGFLRPVRDWNVGKKQEFKDRKTYEVKHENLEID